MVHTFLLEIGLEELPAQYVLGAQQQLKEKVITFLNEVRLSYETVTAYSTPRRLAVLVEGLASRQTSVEVQAKGPAMKIAKDDNGNWTKAAEGFARGQGLTVDDLFVKNVKGVDYAYGLKKEIGKSAKDVLTGMESVVSDLTFSKSMRWSDLDFKYIRPIHWIVALLDGEVIPFEVARVKTSRHTFGHRFLGSKITLSDAKHYVEALESENVIPAYEKRKKKIEAQITELAAMNGWFVPLDAELLEEVTNLVEWPTALYGSFEERFLHVPVDVLITSMKEHQRYFPVFDVKEIDCIKPYFITVRNGGKAHIEMVQKGNEKVLTARLSDAAFFFDDDLKKSIVSCTDKLKNIVFHVELGSLEQKVLRMKNSVKFIAEVLNWKGDRKQLERATDICKFDLVTNMVYEFPELQGRMGEIYALKKGEDPYVAKAINEHYMPRNAEDGVPETEMGAILSVIDKLDTLVGFFTIGKIPTGSADPYALRRQTAGMIQIVMEKNWNISLESLIDYIYEQYKVSGFTKSDLSETKSAICQFLGIRLKTVLQEMAFRFDVIEVALATNIFHICHTVSLAQALQTAVLNPDNKPLFEAFNRTIHITKDATPGAVYEEYMQPEEKALYHTYTDLCPRFKVAVQEGNMKEALDVLKSLREPIEVYFDHIMVNCEDEKLRQNRLTALANIRALILELGNVSLLNLKE